MTFKVNSFEWDESNLRHIEEHPVHPIPSDQVEELFLSCKSYVSKLGSLYRRMHVLRFKIEFLNLSTSQTVHPELVEG